MNKILLYVLLSVLPYGALAQSITGNWFGTLIFGNSKLQIVFHISQSDSGYKASMDSPDQGAKNIPVTSTIYEAPQLTMDITGIGAKYTATLLNDTLLNGTFAQGGANLPLKLSRKEIVLNRPQEPHPPFPYRSIEVTFPNKEAGITLAGTLTLPAVKGKYPAVVLISGSGPQNRDEEIMGHKPFLVIADYLTRNGISVLRFDDRGVGQSEGNFATATDKDFASDAEAAFYFLKQRKDIIDEKIGIIGHSAGGSCAFMLAAKNKKINYIISLAGMAVRGDSLMLKQVELISKAEGMPDSVWQVQALELRKRYALLRQNKTVKEIKKDLYLNIIQSLPTKELNNAQTRKQIDASIQTMTSPWYLYMMNYNPVEDLKRITCPVLALNGAKDLQVDADMNLSSIRNTLQSSGNNKVTVKKYPSLNHLFQHTQTGKISEYRQIEETISPEVLQDMLQWIKKQ